MTQSASPERAHIEHGFLAPKPEGEPVDHCFRCGVETPPGVGLCDAHNRGHLRGPSATQMHATIFGGIVAGVIGFLILANLAITSAGPFNSVVNATSAGPDGAVVLSLTVTNEGDSRGVADCRVTRDGVPRSDDYAFRMQPLAGGETVTLERSFAAPPVGSAGYDIGAVTVLCT